MFVGDDDLSVQPHETEFHVHPCFRAALGATSAIDLRRYEPYDAFQVGSRVPQGITYSSAQLGNTFFNRDDRLVTELRRSCHSVLAQTGRAVSLAQDARDEINQRINRVLDDVNGMGTAAVFDADDQLLNAAHYFDGLSAQLLASGLDSGTGGAGGVARRLEDEARRLRRVAGGSYGSDGSSAGR
ncbi:hypothetical protein ACFY1L_06370 [Streptomyces sp. NPDC001663]|uniref:hypothetical protein n=1 Tax=Streptomyces sp. NPDC001663 TaxID=3364597 RepID=UPI0036CB4651